MHNPGHFPHSNVYGLTGRVFGKHRHQRSGPKVPTDHPDWKYDVQISWQDAWEKEHSTTPTQPVLRAHGRHWAMFRSNLELVESNSLFPIMDHCRKLCVQTLGRKVVILEWGCGLGNAVKDLASDKTIQNNGLVYGYGDVWDKDWNTVEGVKFLFFVKEHLVEYFRRIRKKIDFVFTHGALEYLRGDEFHDYLEDLASILNPGANIVFNAHLSTQTRFWQLESFHPPEDASENTPCVLTRR